MDTKYKRVLLKLSGEALMGENAFGIEPEIVRRIAGEIKDVHRLGVQIAVVIGGGNIFRGLAASAQGFDRVSADHMGMLATVINALALQDALEKMDVFTRVQSAIEMREVAEMFIRMILKATKVDGIYDADPAKVASAKMYSEISYIDVLTQGLAVMDSTAISLSKDNQVPIIVFNIRTKGNIRRVIQGEKIGSLIY